MNSTKDLTIIPGASSRNLVNPNAASMSALVPYYGQTTVQKYDDFKALLE